MIILAWIRNHLRTTAELLLVLAFAVVLEQSHCRAAKVEKLQETAVATAAVDAGFVPGTRAPEYVLTQHLPPALTTAVAAVKKAAPDARVTEAIAATVTIEDTARGTATPKHVVDEYGRFDFDVSGAVPLLTRRQLFKWDAVIVKRRNGDYQFMRSDFRELNPTTKEDIPAAGVKTDYKFQFLEEAAPGPGPFHPIVVAATDQRGALGAGVEFARWRGLSVAGLGFYDRKTSAVDGVLHLAWKIPRTRFAVGPYYSTRGSLGAGVTLEITK